MSAGLEFPAESVLRHAAAVSDAADRMTQARAAVGEVTMDSQAYGQLCQFLPNLLSPVFDSAVGVMNDAVDALEETALKLRATASDMDATDAGSASRLDHAAGSGLDLPL
ncbi:type VII secretion target [Actinoplanes sp. NPDC049599]|uniref:type VII secretion target n=1 Tax=Actinoplanes sp. NPDC049599 TaxID=3363903 RepID=UPI0037B59AB9